MSVVDVHIGEARRMGDFILRREFRGPGDTIEATAYRAETKCGVPASFLIRLRRCHDIPDMLLSNWLRLTAAYSFYAEAVERQAEHQRTLANAAGKNADNSRAYRAGVVLAGEKDGAEE